MDLSFNWQRNPDSIVAFETLDSLFNVLQDFNTLQNQKKITIYSAYSGLLITTAVLMLAALLLTPWHFC